MLVFHAIWFTRSVSRVSSLSPTPTPPPDMRETTACKVSHFRWSVTIKNKASPPSPSFILLFTKYCCCFWIPPNSYKWERYSFICEEIGSATWSLGFSSTYSWQGVLLIAMFAMMITMIIAMMYHWLGPTCNLGFSSIYSWQGGNEVSLPRPGLGGQRKFYKIKKELGRNLLQVFSHIGMSHFSQSLICDHTTSWCQSTWRDIMVSHT